MKLTRNRSSIFQPIALPDYEALPDRNPHITLAPRYWLTAERIAIYSKALLFTQLATALYFVLAELFLSTQAGRYFIANDFRVFWAASHLALQGHGVDAYNIDRLFPAQQLATPLLVYPKAWQYWFYPPTFLLAVLPLALLPYLASYFVFISSSLALYIYTLRRIVPNRTATVLALGFPAVSFSTVNGQNSFITASVACLALIWLDRRPLRSGCLIGLLTIKPHLTVLFFIALLVTKRWKALGTAVLTAVIFLLLGTTVFGTESIAAFLKNIQIAKAFSEYGLLPHYKMPTVFSSARLMGLDIAWANLVHAVVALSAICIVVYIWRRQAPVMIRNASLAVGTLLISPHLFDYDLVWLAWPITWMAITGMQHGWYAGERPALLAAYATPLLGPVFSATTVQVTPIILITMLFYLLRRAMAITSQNFYPGRGVTGGGTAV